MSTLIMKVSGTPEEEQQAHAFDALCENKDIICDKTLYVQIGHMVCSYNTCCDDCFVGVIAQSKIYKDTIMVECPRFEDSCVNYPSTPLVKQPNNKYTHIMTKEEAKRYGNILKEAIQYIKPNKYKYLERGDTECEMESRAYIERNNKGEPMKIYCNEKYLKHTKEPITYIKINRNYDYEQTKRNDIIITEDSDAIIDSDNDIIIETEDSHIIIDSNNDIYATVKVLDNIVGIGHDNKNMCNRNEFNYYLNYDEARAISEVLLKSVKEIENPGSQDEEQWKIYITKEKLYILYTKKEILSVYSTKKDAINKKQEYKQKEQKCYMKGLYVETSSHIKKNGITNGGIGYTKCDLLEEYYHK
jgi:hypothetical protein